MLTIVLRHYALVSLAAPDFAEHQLPKLHELAAEQPALQPAVAALEDLFATNFTAPFNLQEATDRFGPLLSDDQQRAATLALLSKLARQSDQAGELQRSQSLLDTISLLDAGNLDALLYRLMSLADGTKSDGAVRDSLVDEFLFGTNPLNRRNLSTPAQWREVVRLLYLLGNSYARDGILNAAYWPHSAIGLWRLALECDKEGRILDPEGYEPIPGLRESLARAYEEICCYALAWDNYVSAAEAFILLEDGESARAALDEADRIVCRQMLCLHHLLRLERIEADLRAIQLEFSAEGI